MPVICLTTHSKKNNTLKNEIISRVHVIVEQRATENKVPAGPGLGSPAWPKNMFEVGRLHAATNCVPVPFFCKTVCLSCCNEAYCGCAKTHRLTHKNMNQKHKIKSNYDAARPVDDIFESIV
jgi:hypothetical protein